MEVYVDDTNVKSKSDVDHDHDLRKTFDILWAFSMKLNPKKCVFGVQLGKFLGFMIGSHGIEANPDKIQAVLDMKPPQNEREVQHLTGCLRPIHVPICRQVAAVLLRLTMTGKLQLRPAS